MYVDDVDDIADFWVHALDAKILSETGMPENSHSVKIEVLEQMRINFFNKDLISKYSPGVSLDFPSVMLMTDDIEATHEKLSKFTKVISDITIQGDQQTFNFADPEGNYIAIGTV